MGLLLLNKVAFVSGAGRGIGAAAARLFAAEGASVMLAARSEEELKAVAESIGPAADHVVCDLGDRESVEAAVARTVERFGRLDVAFNNGAAIQPPGPLDQLPEEAFDQLVAVNLKGVWLALRAQVAAMTGGGAIVNTSSVGSLRANPELPGYGAVKRAVNSLTESAAVTYGRRGIRVNAIAPGPVVTEMLREWDARSPGVIDGLREGNPMGRTGEPEEIAEAAAWLLSDRASYVNGVVLRVDGGVLA